VADLFQPRTWADGAAGGDLALMTAARGPNRWEAALAAIDDAVEALAGQVEALVSAAGALAPNRVRTGASAQRGTPTRGALFWDETLDRLIVGNGLAWEGADGNALAGDGGTGTQAPTLLVVEQTGEGAVSFTWSAVPDADHYELREASSPLGVAGKTALTGTTTTLTGLAPRVYEFWLVAAYAGGTLSADSNHELIDVTTAGGSGSASSPAGILGLGSGGGFWDVGIGLPSGHVNYPYSQLAAGFTSTPYFVPTSDLSGVLFRAPMHGGLTSDAAGGARSELREYLNGTGTKAAWVAAFGTHVLEYTFRVEHLQPIRPYVIVGQVHDAANDSLSIRIRGAALTGNTMNVEAWIYGSRVTTNLVTGYAIGTDVKIRIEFSSGTLRIYVNGVLKVTNTTAFANKTAAEQYFKLGAYAGSSTAKYGESASEYAQVRIVGAIVCTHSTGSTSGVEVVQEKAFQLTSTAENSTVAWWENYDYIQDILDGRGYTGGIVGFTSATGDMLELVQDYAARKTTGNALAPYLPNLQRCADFGDTVSSAVYGVNGGGASTKANTELGAAYRTAWANAANTDAVFRLAQRDYRARVYWQPAYVAAQADGLGPLGIAIYYDTSVNHGPGQASGSDGSFDNIRARTTGTKPSAGGSESTWLTNFLNVRSSVLTAWGDNPSDGRISMFRGLLTAGKLTLATPFSWSVYGDTFTMSTDPTPRTD
jgi:chitosanase